MALCTKADEVNLQLRGLLLAYTKKKDQFDEIGRLVYRVLRHMGQPPAAPPDMEGPLSVALNGSKEYNDALAAYSAHTPPKMYEALAGCLARYMLEHHWSDLRS